MKKFQVLVRLTRYEDVIVNAKNSVEAVIRAKERYIIGNWDKIEIEDVIIQPTKKELESDTGYSNGH